MTSCWGQGKAGSYPHLGHHAWGRWAFGVLNKDGPWVQIPLLSPLSSAPQAWARIVQNDWTHILLKLNCDRLSKENSRGKTELKRNPNCISWQPCMHNSWCVKAGAQPLPSQSQAVFERTLKSLTATKLSLSLLMVGPAWTRKNILSKKTSWLEGDNAFSSLSTPKIHPQCFLHESSHVCYFSLLVGDSKPGSSIPGEYRGKHPCLFCNRETASKGLGRERERDTEQFLLKYRDCGYSEAWSPHRKIKY